MLFNFEMDSRDRAVVLLAGLPQLNSTLRLSIHEPFRQRIVMNYNLEGMSKTEIAEGDVCVIEVGESHAIENPNDEPLEIMALVINMRGKCD